MPENTGALEPKVEVGEECARKLGMKIHIHVNVSDCYIKYCTVPTNVCIQPQLTLLIQHPFYCTKSDLPCTKETPDFDAGF